MNETTATLSRRTKIAAIGGIVLLTAIAYLPIVQCGFIWDDDAYVINNSTLRDIKGLWRIWTEPTSIPQYYPLVHTTFWIEYQLWRLNALGYHLVNVALQMLNGVLWWLVLRRLKVPGAWVAAAIFAVHPVHVESVAWITERKNVLSGAFYLAAALAYLRFSPPDGVSPQSDAPQHRPDSRWYCLALLLFVMALLSKTVTATLPAALLLALWWRRGHMPWRDAVRLVPFFIVGIASGLYTAHLEKTHVGAMGDDFDFNLLERTLIAGRVVWFYAGKLIWPQELIFFYQRWHIDASMWWQYAFPVAAGLLLLALGVMSRRIGRGPITGVLFFGGTLFPAMGFFNVFPFSFSFVADHFQYMASMGIIAVIVGVAATLVRRRVMFVPTVAVVLAALCVRTMAQIPIYTDLETLYTDTIRKNPYAWAAHNNYANYLVERGRVDEAEVHYNTAIGLIPDDPMYMFNLASFQKTRGNHEMAVRFYREAIKLKPDYGQAHHNLANLLEVLEDDDGAIHHYQRAVESIPNHADGHYSLAKAYMRKGDLGRALHHAREAHVAEPERDTYRQMLSYLCRLSAWGFASYPDPKRRNGEKAVVFAEMAIELADRPNPRDYDALAAAHAENGDFPLAEKTAAKAADMARQLGDRDLLIEIEKRRKLYADGLPYRNQ